MALLDDLGTLVDQHLAPARPPSIDAAMGLGVDGVTHPTHKFDPAAFAAMNNTIELAKLVLLDQRGLEQLTGRPYPQPNVMLGWPKSMDGEFQWLWLSPRDGSSAYGTGAFPLWRDCAARRDVFHALFSWWGDDGSLPSGWTRDRGFPVPPGEACAA